MHSCWLCWHCMPNLQDSHTCGRCHSASTCAAVHAVLEGGNADSSGMEPAQWQQLAGKAGEPFKRLVMGIGQALCPCHGCRCRHAQCCNMPSTAAAESYVWACMYIIAHKESLRFQLAECHTLTMASTVRRWRHRCFWGVGPQVAAAAGLGGVRRQGEAVRSVGSHR